MTFVHPRDFIRNATRRSPGKTAVISAGEPVSYAALNDLIGALARRLKAAGVGAGDTVALSFPNSLEFVVAFYAAMQVGAVVFPVSPKLTGKELAGLLVDAQADCVIHPKGAPQPLAAFQSAGVRIALQLGFSGSDLLLEPAVLRVRPLAADKPARVRTRYQTVVRQYSSGSTGTPKHMLKTSRNLFHDAWHFAASLGLTEKEVFLGAAPFYHNYGLLSLLTAGYLGATLVVVKQFLPHAVLEHIRKDHVTAWLATPAMLEILADCYLDQTPSLPSLRCCVSSTAPLTKAVFERFHRRFGLPVFQVYGSTESATNTVQKITDYTDETLVGTPMPGIEVQIFDEHFRRLPRGRVGRVGVKAPSACDGYLHNAAASAQTFRAGYVFPGDLGHLDAQGALHVVGRDNVINVGGMKVDALEVERVLNSHPAVAESLVYGSADGNGQKLSAAVVARSGGLTVAELLDHCWARLSDYKLPKVIHIVDTLPRDEHGKIVRKAIEEHVRRPRGSTPEKSLKNS
ncbi:MAG: AMP-binding protein [Verrucomicrobiia bacterium]|jgi:long-chain acyl-CoA synthetase